MKKILVTGGAGFIGSHLVDALVERGHKVCIFDNLDQQVHEGRVPSYLNKEAEFIQGDVREPSALKKALKGVEIIFHQAAAVGVGQSMYEIYNYMDANTLGTALLLELLVKEKNVEKLIVASSMSIYGEGTYSCLNCDEVIFPRVRADAQLAAREWEFKCPLCGGPTAPRGTNEDKPLYPTSIYAISKRDQEEMCLILGRAYGLPAVALRYFNVYGPRQALSNPYTGVVAIFSSCFLNNNPPLIFEDGKQTRDFIHVSDIVKANLLAMEREEANYEVFGVGTGKPTSVLEVAQVLSNKIGCSPEVKILNKYRAGDIRHCYADITKIKEKLGFRPEVGFEDGMEELVGWLTNQKAVDKVAIATSELEAKGLIQG